MPHRRLIFEFRDFTMRQAESGQRINTDSCVFGDALRPLPIATGSSIPGEYPRTCLDIGCGTGLLAIMMAAKFPAAKVTGIEPASGLAKLARENAAESPWRENITIVTQRLQDFARTPAGTFELIACNPPFFRNSQRSADHLRALARHDDDLPMDDLQVGISKLLAPDGSAWILYPSNDAIPWTQKMAAGGLYPAVRILLADNPASKPHACITAFTRNKKMAGVPEETITYRDAAGGNHSGWMRAYRKRWHPF